MLRPSFRTSPFRVHCFMLFLFTAGLLGSLAMAQFPTPVNAAQTFQCDDGGPRDTGANGYEPGSQCEQYVQTYSCSHSDSPGGPIDTLTCGDNVPDPRVPTPTPTVPPTGTDRHWPIIVPGDWGHEVSTIQKLLRQKGYDVATDGRFGPATQSVVEEYQEDIGLDPNGIVDPLLWEQLTRGVEVSPGSSYWPIEAVQTLLTQKFDYWDIGVNGIFDTPTEAAVYDLQRAHGLPQTGTVDANTWSVLLHSGNSNRSVSVGDGLQMSTLLDKARSLSAGKEPDGQCYAHVAAYIDEVGYGNIRAGEYDNTVPPEYWPEARNFAEYMNKDSNAERLGLRRLELDNPYEAPPGAIVVVRAGTPGTEDPTAGDIAIRGVGEEEGKGFYNGGDMHYYGSDTFYPGNDYVLGIYVPDI